MTSATENTPKQELLAAAGAKSGFVPNALEQMSASPAALEVYMRGQAALAAEYNRLSHGQRNLVQLATSR